MLNQALLNGLELHDTYGVVVENGLKNMEIPADPKQVEEYDWPERNGKEYRFTDKVQDATAQLDCVMVADTMGELLTNKDALFGVLQNGQPHSIYVFETDSTHTVKYNGVTGFEFVKPSEGAGLRFSLQFTILKGALPDTIKILDGNG